MDERDQRLALVTGGSNGLGLATAMELARRGWSIFIQRPRARPAADEAVAEIRSAAKGAGRDVDVFSAGADLGLGADREQLVESALEPFGRIDMLVNAAAGQIGASETQGTLRDVLEVSEEAYRRVMDAGVTATLFLTQLVANEMVRMVEAALVENPKIVILNSLSAYTTSVDHAPHCVSRAALAMVTRLLADRLGEHGINVYEVRAGIITAGAGDPAHARYDALISEGLTPIRRWGRPGDVARAVAAIGEGLLSFSTGEVINVDGGFHLRRL